MAKYPQAAWTLQEQVKASMAEAYAPTPSTTGPVTNTLDILQREVEDLANLVKMLADRIDDVLAPIAPVPSAGDAVSRDVGEVMPMAPLWQLLGYQLERIRILRVFVTQVIERVQL